MSDVVLVERDNGIARVTLNRPEAMNALNRELFIELRRILGEIDADPDVKVCLIEGAGGRAFCVGVDLKERQNIHDHQADEYRKSVVFPFYLGAHERTKPMIAAVTGYCLGGGFELALAADVIIAGESAQFGLPEARWGLIPAGGALQMLTRIIGPLRTKELALTGRRISAQEAHSMGVVSHLVPDDEVGDKAIATAKMITENVQMAVQGVKRSVDHLVGFREGFGYDIEVSNVCYFSPERKAALGKFGNQKENPSSGENAQGEDK
ncbi:MAG: enoyl-CoA hydratase/isomerase family protein [Acidimicrobiaceae bacterium]|nr:enoyl-CoA hydratase/isomerase family protein [Acidimicrobiaceae bacterium]